MDTDEVVLWVCLGVAVLLGMLFLVFTVTTGGVKAFALYVLFPIFIISFLVGMTLLVQLIIKLNDKLDGNTNGLNKKIDTNNFMIKDAIVNVDDFLQNVDYTVIIEDRNVPVDPNNPDEYGIPFRYKPQVYEPSLEIPGVTGPEGLKNIENSSEFSGEILNENNIKSVIVNEENIDITTPIIEVSSKDTSEEIVLEEHHELDSIAESLSINETLYESSNNSIDGSIDDLLSLTDEPLEYHELMLHDDFEDDNLSVFTTTYNIENLYENKPLHEEFLNVYDLFEE